MKIKTLFLSFFILFFVNIAFGSISTVSVSPFVNRGFSYTYEISFFPVWDYNNGYYNFNNFNGISSINTTESYYRSYLAGNTYFSIGIKDKVEIELFPTFLFIIMVHSQIKVNVFNYIDDEHRFFGNFSISPFFGAYFAGSRSYYGGISMGTKRLMNERVTLELYSSPLIYNGLYEILEGGESPSYGYVDFLTINIPMGAKLLVGRTRKFSCDFGIIPIVKLKETWIHTSPVSIFTKASFHLGRKRQLKP
jgi:hypothetical protein